MILPSEDLLSEVLGGIKSYVVKSKSNITHIYVDIDSLLMIDFDNGDWYCINIYELQHLMKEWAFSKHNIVIPSGRDNPCFAIKDFTSKEFTAHTEFEAVVQATQYIYDNLSNK